MGRGIEKALDVQIEHPVHVLPVNPGVECVQRIVLAAPRSEPVGKTQEVLLVDGLQNVHDRLLDDLVLQAQNAEWPLGTVRLRDIRPSGRSGSIAAPMHSLVQVFQFLFERFPIGLPCHAIGPGRSVTRERAIAPLQDLLSLGNEARMNVPGQAAGNWEWRVTEKTLSDEPFRWLCELTKNSNRGGLARSARADGGMESDGHRKGADHGTGQKEAPTVADPRKPRAIRGPRDEPPAARG